LKRTTLEHNAALRTIREYVHTRTLVRYPVSTFRRRLGVFLLACFVIAFGFYTFSTTDEAIRRRALQFLRKATPGGVEIDVGGASFQMFEGITLRNVHVYVPYDERVDPSAKKRSDREIFSATTLKLVHDPWRLLFGNLRVKRIIAVEPTIVLTNNTETGARNWELLNDPKRNRSGVRLRHRPIVTIRSAAAKVTSIDRDGGRVESMQILDADVRPAPQSGTAYDIEIRQYRDPIGRATVHFDPAEGMVANSPFVATRTIKLQLPAPLQSLFDSLSVEGDVRLTRFVYDNAADGDRDTRIEMRDVKCHVPLWLLFGEPGPAVDPAIADLNLSLVDLENLDGRVELVGEEIRIDLTGVMNGAPCSVKGSLTRSGEDNQAMGVDLEVKAEGFPAPEGAVRRRVLADERAPRAIHEFLHDYDPHGRLDVDLRFARATNAPGTLRMDGVIVPQGVTGAATWFPFALDDVHGAVRFEGPDVYLEDLHGRHGSGVASVSGTIDRRTGYSSLALEVDSYNLPLDVHLFMAMSERYQGVWRRFMPYGTANIRAVLTRTGGPKSLPLPKLNKRVTVDLRDVIAMFRPYPYRIEHVDGRLIVDEDRILLRDITGFANGAPILLDGYALLEPDREAEIDMRLEGRGVGIDNRVASAFGGADGALARFNPRGNVDLIGGLSRREGDEDLRWDFHVDGRDLRIRHQEFPYALSNVAVDLDVRTDDVVVNQLTGRHGDSLVSATARWSRGDSAERVELVVSSDDLALDRELYDALPAGAKSAWDMFAPTGRVRVRSRHTFAGAGAAQIHTHTTRIEPIQLAAKFKSLPLPITGLSGAVDITSTEVRLANVSGNIGGSRISVDGVVHLDPQGGMRGDLKLVAGEIEVTPDVLGALPTGLGEWMKRAKLRGRMSLDFSRLAFESDSMGRLRWRIEGRIGLAGVSARLEMSLDDADGEMRGVCVIEPDGGIQFDADAKISHIQFAGWDMRDVRGRIVSDPSAGALMIEKGVARLYGGDATGDAQILFSQDHTAYEASLLFRDVQIQEFLDAQKDKGLRPDARTEPTEKARGTIAGNFAMRGETGRRGYREGAGTVYIRDAQVWKLPFALAIFQVLNLTPDENVFHDGRIEMFLTDQKLILHKIDLQGKAMAFIGGGTLNLDSDDLDIRLLAASPVRVQVPLLTEILEGMAREAMEIHVTGTVDNPKIRPEPLRQARDVIGTLFPEIPRSRR